jgi:GTP-binding protein
MQASSQTQPPPPAHDFAAEEIEAGRRLFASDWQFAAAAGSLSIVPGGSTPEVAFVGRSNVGKSSLINALTGRRALARTSHTPGRTQELIFFKGPSALTLVDMPGYGYAAAPKSKVASWTELIRAYLLSRANLKRVYVLIDGRHGLKPVDGPVLDGLDRAAVSYQLVLTKADEVKAPDLDAIVTRIRGQIANRPAAFPGIVITSAKSKLGIPELRAAIARVIAETATRPFQTKQ